MAKIGEIADAEIAHFIQRTEEQIRGCAVFEEAAQKLTDCLYREFKDSVVLARVFVSVPFEKLPSSNREFVKNLAAAKGITPLLKDQTLILSLAGTRGDEEAWNSRVRSKGHVGIPLASADFIDLIPMMSRLMRALGVPLDWITSADRSIVTKAVGKIAGVFYVPDAATSVDEQGRKIIPTQDFVHKYGIKTVFGAGGGYILGAAFAVVIVFTRDMIAQEKTEAWLPLINVLKSATTNLVSRGKIFSGVS
jgi:hypothetical protein